MGCGKGNGKNGSLESACKLKRRRGGRDFWDWTKTHTVWHLFLLTLLPELGMVVHTYDPSHSRGESRKRVRIRQLGLCSKTLSQNKNVVPE